MVLFDTNIFIYAGAGQISLSKLDGVEACYSSITVIETLGFREITSVEQRKLTQILAAYQKIDLTEAIIERAVALRQDTRMSLGDAIVAATALEQGCPLWTANTRDFDHIEGLELYSPLL
jgi:predicted nucleic acid-binding protein